MRFHLPTPIFPSQFPACKVFCAHRTREVSMNWKFVWGLSVAFGVVTGILSLFVVGPPAVGVAVTLAVNIACAIVLVLKTPAKYFTHGFWTGFFASVIKALVLAVFADTYLRANPGVAQQFSQMPIAISPRVILVIAAPIAGIMGGLILGAITWVVSKILGPDKPAATPAPPPEPPPLA
jgi:hypothetical protein